MSEFAARVDPRLELTPFHRTFYELLTLFARGDVRRLMISVPPQHGKSLGTSNLLPAFMLGRDPRLRVCIGSYSFALARRFGIGVQRIIGSDEYAAIFPGTFLKGMRQSERGTTALRTADEFDLVGAEGGLRLVGRECSLTGNRVDVMILDDLYKDAAEANSPIVREAAWDWYTSVVRTRMHNESREIVVFTRWHEDDLIGRIARSERVVDIASLDEAVAVGRNSWVRVNFEAVKQGVATSIDPRQPGEALWSARHSAELLEQKRLLDPVVFEALYQGNPTSKEGLLYPEFQTYDQSPPLLRVANYTDTADVGDDKLCSICYSIGDDGGVYVVDVVYSCEPMEVTERLVADMITRWCVTQALIESNSGGRGFARAVQGRVAGCAVRCFHQTANKESRILTNATLVGARIRMPSDWRQRWPEFAADLTSFRRVFKANRHDDAADVLTGIVETVYGNTTRKIRSIKFG